MRNRSFLLIALPLQLLAQTSRVPFVGCETDGQAKAVEAPKGVNQAATISAGSAELLAYYTEGWRGTGVLAPRGWYCVGLYGSGGSVLYVTPESISGPQGGISGPIVELAYMSADNGSGRYDIAQVLARVFPGQRAFVESVIDGLGLPGAGGLKFGPFPRDRLIVQNDRLVQFQTPPHTIGLGTINWVKPGDDPIDGVAIFEGPAPHLLPYLLMLRVRLPRQLRDLTPVIIHDLLIRQSSDAR